MMDRDRRLEFFVANIAIPSEFWNNLYLAETGEKNPSVQEKIKRYEAKLNYFAFAKTPDYNGFKAFLDRNSAVFPGRYPSLFKRMTDEEVDYLFGRIKEIRVDFEIEKVHSTS